MSNIIPFPTQVAKARSWIRQKLIQRGTPPTGWPTPTQRMTTQEWADRYRYLYSYSARYMSARERFRREVARALGTRRTGWSHICSGASGITVGFIGATACPYCGARAPKPEPRA